MSLVLDHDLSNFGALFSSWDHVPVDRLLCSLSTKYGTAFYSAIGWYINPVAFDKKDGSTLLKMGCHW